MFNNTLINYFSTGQRLQYMRWLVGTGIIIAITASWQLWSNERSSPTAPLLGTYSFISGYAALALRLLLIVGAVLFIARVKHIEWLLIIVLILYTVDDLNRLMPNTYQYAVLLLFFALLYRVGDENVLTAARIIQAGTYLYTGIFKLNGQYVDQISAFSFNAFHIYYPPTYLKYIVLLAAFAEIGIGLAFLLGRQIKLAIASSALLHVGISIVLYKAGWNNALIAYNFFLLAGNIILFYNSAHKLLGDIEQHKTVVQKMAVVLFILLPALNIMHWWPDFMSASMYSCRSPNVHVMVNEQLEKQLPPLAQQCVYDLPDGRALSMQNWLELETHTVVNPQVFVYKKMHRQLCDKYNCSDSVQLIIY